MWVGEPPHTRLTATGRAGRYGPFARGQNLKKRGQFSDLGVKRWVVDARFSQRRAILYGVTIGVTAISCFEQGKQSARLSAVHFVRGRAP